ncbi:MAG: RDD family protein [Deltaproteobacteria bacterium]|nr:RDD family protein [Deltaproteobacteria bacterium]
MAKRTQASPEAGKKTGPQGPRWPKADLLHRAVARFADLVIAILIGRLVPEIGPLIAIAYILLADGLMEGQSPGKRLGGVKVINTRTNRAARYRESALRNMPFALVGVFAVIPLIGWVLLPLGGLFVAIFESYMAWTDRQGLRIGDVFADTQVIDGSVPIEDGVEAKPLATTSVTAPPEPA